jgi:hypothetical protein
MNKLYKNIEALRITDLRKFAVWEFVNDERPNRILVRPVKRTSVSHLRGRVIGTQVRLANGMSIWALLGNVDARNATLNQHLLTISVLCNNHWFTMARYHDIDRERRGAAEIAKFLGLAIDQVFPITYDLRTICKGLSSALVGKIDKEPTEKLTRAQIIALAVP